MTSSRPRGRYIAVVAVAIVIAVGAGVVWTKFTGHASTSVVTESVSESNPPDKPSFVTMCRPGQDIAIRVAGVNGYLH